MSQDDFFFIVKATKHVQSDIGEILGFVFCYAKKIKDFAHFRLEQGRGWLSAFNKEWKFIFADKYVQKVHLLQFVLPTINARRTYGLCSRSNLKVRHKGVLNRSVNVWTLLLSRQDMWAFTDGGSEPCENWTEPYLLISPGHHLEVVTFPHPASFLVW